VPDAPLLAPEEALALPAAVDGAVADAVAVAAVVGVAALLPVEAALVPAGVELASLLVDTEPSVPGDARLALATAAPLEPTPAALPLPTSPDELPAGAETVPAGSAAVRVRLPDADSGAVCPGVAAAGTEAVAPRSPRTASPDATAAPDVVGQRDPSTSLAGRGVVPDAPAAGVVAGTVPAGPTWLVSTPASADPSVALADVPVAGASVALSVVEPSHGRTDDAAVEPTGVLTGPEAVEASPRAGARA
jgi:hypothetical protein